MSNLLSPQFLTQDLLLSNVNTPAVASPCVKVFLLFNLNRFEARDTKLTTLE